MPIRALTGWGPAARRPTVRPKQNWKEQVEKDMALMKDWRKAICARRQWRKIVNQAKEHQDVLEGTEKICGLIKFIMKSHNFFRNVPLVQLYTYIKIPKLKINSFSIETNILRKLLGHLLTVLAACLILIDHHCR